MNSKCSNKTCIYHKTCLIDNLSRDKKCTGKLSIKNQAHPNYQAITRGSDEKKE